MKNYLVIGASSGVGYQLANVLNETGNMVFGTYYSNPITDRSNYHYLNVLDADVDLSFLPETIDGVAYCPGSIDLKPFSRFKTDELQKDLELQVMGAVKVIQAVLPKVKAAGKGSIVLFSTVAVQTGFPFHTQVSISKGAIEGLTKALAAELAPTIRVNAIAPSITNTPLAGKLLSSDEKIAANGNRHPMKRVGEAADIAEMAAFLLSEKSSWITGQILPVDGGMSTLRTN
jgi:NAD(P)-dependent dehydrogenase (short-subunit alcohol dehydrogenase family)